MTPPKHTHTHTTRHHHHTHALCTCADPERNRLLVSDLIETIARMVLLARSGPAGQDRPFFPEAAIIQAVYRVPTQPSPEDNERLLWGQVGLGVRVLLCFLDSRAASIHVFSPCEPCDQVYRMPPWD